MIFIYKKMNVKRKNKYIRNQSHSPNSSLIISSDLPPISLYNILINNQNLINEKDIKGETFLSYSIKRDKLDVLKLLLTSPLLDMSYKDKDGNTYLLLATLYQRENMIIPLIQKGINLNIKNNDGNTALHLAYMLNNENIIKILIDYNIDINIINNKGEKANEVKERIMSPKFIYSLGSKEIIELQKEKDKNYNTEISVNKSDDKLKNQMSKYKSEDNVNTEMSINKSDDDKLKNQMSKYKSDDIVNTVISINKCDESNYNTQISNNNIISQISINKSKEENELNNNNNDNDVNIGLSLVKQKKKMNESLETTHNSKNNNTQTNIEENDSKIKESVNDDFFDLSIELPKKENKDMVVVEETKKDDLKDNDNYKKYNDDEMVNFSIDNFNEKSSVYKKESTSKSNIDYNYSYSDNDDNDYNDYNDYNNKNENNNNNNDNNNNNNKNDDSNLSNNSNEKYDENFNPLDDREEDFFKIKNDDEDDDYNNKSIHNKKKLNTVVQSNKSIKLSDMDFIFPNKINQTNIIKQNTNIDNSSRANTERKKNPLSFNFNQPIRASPIKNKENNMNKNPLYIFLQKIELEKYFSNLINLGFDDINFLINEAKKGKMGITDENLKQSGIKLPGERAKILIKIQEEAKNFNTKLPDEIYYICKDLKNYKKDIHIQKLYNWLNEIKLGEYLINFIKAGYYSKELIIMQMISKHPLTLDILEKEIGIIKLGHRKRILNKLNDEAYDIKKKLSSVSLGDFFDINVNKTYEQVKEKCYIF